MNFNIIEGEYVDVEKVYPAFKNDYLYSPIYATELRVKYGLTHSEYRELSQKVNEEFGFSRRPSNGGGSKGKYYYRHSRGFVIQKKIDNENCYIGIVPTEELAQRIVKLCIKSQWDIDVCKKICDEWKEDYFNSKFHQGNDDYLIKMVDYMRVNRFPLITVGTGEEP